MTEKDFYFDTPVYGRVACNIRARSAKEARQMFEEGFFGDVMHMEFLPILTERDRRKLAKELALGSNQ